MNKEKLKEEVKELSKFEENWDGYDAEPFTKEIIDKTNEVIDCFNDKYDDPCVVPSNCGIQFEWENGKHYGLEIYVEGDGLSYLKVIGDNMTDWKETNISDINEVNELLYWLYLE
jgi:hypothetical protein